MKISAQSAWSRDEIESFLRAFEAPLRVAATTERGAPLLCSLWFHYDDGRLLCATQRDAKIARCLSRDGRCAFELAPNTPPYFGVRGQGEATLETEGAADLLARLTRRFLDERDAPLREWLLSRADSEVVISIGIERITAWDFRDRMADRGDVPGPP